MRGLSSRVLKGGFQIENHSDTAVQIENHSDTSVPDTFDEKHAESFTLTPIWEPFFIEKDNSFSDESSFLDQGIIDSTGILELVSFMEQSFSIQEEDEELVPENLDSIMNINNYLLNKVDRS